MLRALTPLLVLWLCWSHAVPATAEMYRYVDEQGGVHLADDATKLPEPDRAELVSPQAGDASPVTVLPAPRPTPPRARDRNSAREADPVCRIVLRKRARTVEGDDYVYTGEVVNMGTGRASGVRVKLEDLDARGRVLSVESGKVAERSLGPGGFTTFRLVIAKRDRKEARRAEAFVRSAFEGSYSGCVSSASAR